MTKAVLNFNTLGSAQLNGFSKIRVRVVNGVMQIKPTNRVAGRDLVDLRSKKQATPSFRATIDAATMDQVPALHYFQLAADKYGWFTVVPCDKPVLIPGKPALQGGSVSDR